MGRRGERWKRYNEAMIIVRTRNDEWLNWSSGRRNGKEGRETGNIQEIKTVGLWYRLNVKVAEK